MKQEITTTGPDGLPCTVEVDIEDATTAPKAPRSWAPGADSGAGRATASALASIAAAAANLVGPDEAAALNEAAEKLTKG